MNRIYLPVSTLYVFHITMPRSKSIDLNMVPVCKRDTQQHFSLKYLLW